jgi:hypothetical protein
MSAVAVTSANNHRRIERAREWLEKREPGEEVLIVGSSLDGPSELVRQTARLKGAAFGWHRMTLAQLAGAVAMPALASRGLAPLSSLGAEAIVARLVHGLKEASGLGRYAAVAATPGFPRSIARVIGELRLAKLQPDAVAAVANDLAKLLSAYEGELAEAKLTDWAGVLVAATGEAHRSAHHRLVGLPILLLDPCCDNQAELNFLDALAARAPAMFVTLPAGDRQTVSRIRDGLRIPIEDLDTAGGAAQPTTIEAATLANLQRFLFTSVAAPAGADSDHNVQVFSAPGEGRECVEIARRVLQLAQRGTPLDRIAVLLRSPEVYRGDLEEAFRRADIPVHVARGAVRPDPAGRAFCSLLWCAAEGLSARRFAEYLSLGEAADATPTGEPPDPRPRSDLWSAPDQEHVPLPTTNEDHQHPSLQSPGAAGRNGEAVNEGQLRAPRRWERLLTEAAVIGGRDRWRRRLDGLANDIALRLEELGEEDEAQSAALRRTLDDLAAFASYALPLIEELDRLPAAASWGEWLDRLGTLATRALRNPERVLAVLAELAPMGPVGPVPLSEVLIVLADLLLEVAAPPSPHRHGKVFVGPIASSRGMSFEAVFVPGLAERMFPRRIVEEPILLDALRDRIDGGLATNQTRLEGERFQLMQAASAADHRICFSYPRLDLEHGRPRVPSFYALEAVRAAQGKLPDFAELTRRAETATIARLGWPAPSDPADAIDNAEHDLAILGRLLADDREHAGAARYLLTANPYLARALRARYQRWSKSWTPADGLLSRSETIRIVMARHSLGARSYSPTALQNYARCPYRFFLQTVHGLAPREVAEAIEQLDPLQRGSLIHDVQFELLALLRQQGLLPVRPGNLALARQRLDQVLAKVAARHRDDLAPAIERVWEDGIAAISADLREWLRRASEDNSGYVPRHFELSFGLEHRPERRQADPRSVPAAVGLDCGIQLRGSIDLVEHHPSGDLRVTDHKTGKVEGRRGQVIGGGKTLQPLFYALAAEKLFAGQAAVTSGRLYYCTSAGDFAEYLVPLSDYGRALAVEIAQAVGDAVARPFLPAAPDKRECDRCDFRVVCGPYEEVRSAVKPRGNLEPLLDLRGRP